ncbi:MAG: glycoside hydrolase family 3 N-terminal domain-containing protein [Bacteroidales bacterium]|nr:glycoside hydrolase family 3 N-terminal domain-containing protein [Bacteroidales bacterium]
MLNKYITLFVFLLLFHTDMVRGQENGIREAWVDSVFHSLTDEERIAQLMVVRANDPGKDYFASVEKFISRYNIGGVCFFRNHPHHQAETTNRWQQLAKTPLLVSIDAEWGLGMRLDSTTAFPYQMTLGAIRDNGLIYQMGAIIAMHCQRMGIHMNFAPVVDINSNPGNPVIGMRSFGQNRENVMLKGIAYMQGLQEHGIIATAKHFPGHGDTDTDSHKTLPVVPHTKERLDSLELYPFRHMIRHGLGGIMIAHLYIPAYEKDPGLASTLSPEIVDGLLRNELGFDGLIVTDALDMKGVTKHHKPGVIGVKALQAGNDILLLPADVPVAIKKIRQAVENGELAEDVINQRCRKVLRYKYDAGLATRKHIRTDHLIEDLNDSRAKMLKRKLYESSLTLLRNEYELIPLVHPDTLRIAYVSVGASLENDHFAKTLQLYGRIASFAFERNDGKKDITALLKNLEPYNLVIIGVRNTNMFAYDDYGITQADWVLVNKIAAAKKTILNLFASPYSLVNLDKPTLPDGLVVSYQDEPLAGEIAAELIFGGVGAQGKLPVGIHGLFKEGDGLETMPLRLCFTEPGALGIQDKYIRIADSIAMAGIRLKAYPGCQVLAAKDGKVFYHKAFGYHTYEKEREVRPADLYDLASITKIAATTLALMDLYGKGMIDIDQRLSKYLPFLGYTDKKDIIIRELLAHQSRLQAWIPYFRYTVHDTVRNSIYADEPGEDFPVRVAEGMYIRKNYFRGIFDSIRFSGLRENNQYKYSDLGFYMLKESMESILNLPFEKFVEQEYYGPMGLPALGYLPLKRFPRENIAPTEDDRIFRKQLLQGDVHDQGAAMLGGVSGHAGLFSNAFDLAAIMQMFLQGGEYGGRLYIKKEVLEEFTKTQFPLNLNRRGIGFDKPLLEYEEDGPTCKSASPQSFGHSGFTGTYAWADPANGLVYIFLSNSIHPDGSNRKLVELNIRTSLHQMFYDALIDTR